MKRECPWTPNHATMGDFNEFPYPPSVEAQFVPPSGAFIVAVECVVELCVVLVLAYSLSL